MSEISMWVLTDRDGNILHASIGPAEPEPDLYVGESRGEPQPEPDPGGGPETGPESEAGS